VADTLDQTADSPRQPGMDVPMGGPQHAYRYIHSVQQVILVS
jgi:hypothetical protein